MHAPRPFLAALLFATLLPAGARAGLYYSGEHEAELPARWRGFLADQRTLRLLGVTTPASGAVLLWREQYREAARKLEEASRTRPLTADESADLGALYVRLGQPAKAVNALRAAQRAHPDHFRVAANLGTAWQAQGELSEAAAALQDAVRLAPPRWRALEAYHLKLVRLRQREGKRPSGPDDLFGVAYAGEPGEKPLPARKDLPADAVAAAQQLALWLPADGRLLWQLGELANLHGDVRTAAAILDGCVGEFGMGDPALRKHRQTYRAAADAIARLPDEEHARYRGDLAFKSARPLPRRFDASRLPPIQADGVNELPWPLLADTTVGKGFHPDFPRHLGGLDGKRVALTGYMQPLGTEGEGNRFLLIEYPVGCWFCETPEPTGMVLVTLPPGQAAAVKRGPVKVTGVLKLNRDDPEEFLYTVQHARVADPD